MPRARKTTFLAPPSARPDRRSAPRYRCRWNCNCSSISLTKKFVPWNASVNDISADGIQLAFSHPIPLGTFLAINLLSTPGQLVRQLRGRVVRSKRHEQGWIVGCALNPELSSNELDALL